METWGGRGLNGSTIEIATTMLLAEVVDCAIVLCFGCMPSMCGFVSPPTVLCCLLVGGVGVSLTLKAGMGVSIQLAKGSMGLPTRGGHQGGSKTMPACFG